MSKRGLAIGFLALGLALGLLTAGAPLAAEPQKAALPVTPGLEVGEIVFCAAIKDRAPEAVADTFPADIYGVYCFTKVVGARDTTSIRHVWYRGGQKVAERRLAVRSSPWRTWSSKEMKEEWRGEWTVEVVASDGRSLASRKFFLK